MRLILLLCLAMALLQGADPAADLRQGAYQSVVDNAESSLFQRMQALLELGRHDDIQKLTVEQNDWPALALQAESFYQTGQQEKRTALVERARAASKQQQWQKDAPALSAMASIIGESDIQYAWRLIQDAHTADKMYLEAYIVGARLCIAAFSWQYALGEAKIAKNIQGNDPRVLSLAARAFISDNKFTQAHGLLDQALEINPHLVSALNMKALLALQQRDDEDMNGYLEKAQAINPQHIETLALWAALADNANEKEKRDTYIAQALALNPHGHELFAVLAESAERRYRYEDALAWGRRAQQVCPDYWQGDYIVAVNLLRLGEEPEGYQLMDQAFQKNKFNVWAYNMLTVLDEDFKHGDYVLHHSKYFSVKIPKSIDQQLWLYLERWLDPLYEEMAQRYAFMATGPKAYDGRILILFFDKHGKFSARTAGLPGLGARGATFGQVITMPMTDEQSISSTHPWFSTLQHEIAHVFTIQKTKRRIPRWLTEGISEWDEKEPHVELDGLLLETFARDAFPKMEDLSNGIHYPKFPAQISLTYYISGLAVQYFEEQYGFAFINKVLDDLAAGLDLYESLAKHSGQSMDSMNAAFKSYVQAYCKPMYAQRRFDKKAFDALKEENNKQSLTGQSLSDLSLAAIQHGELNLAQLLIDRLLEDADWEDAATILQAQISLRFARNAAEAYDLLSQVLAVDEEHGPANYWALRAAMQMNDDTAIEVHGEALLQSLPRLTRGPNNPYAQLLRIYEANEDYDAMHAVLERHLKHDPFSFPAQRAYALELFRREQWQQASEALERALQFSIYDARVHACFARCQEQLGNKATAIRAYRIALQLDETLEMADEGLERLQVNASKP